MPANHTFRRRHRRFSLPPMYSAVTATRREGGQAGAVTSKLYGHVYDISAGGVRIELDVPLDPGESVVLLLDLPGTWSEVEAWADVVWVHDAQDDPGPRRMALQFTEFTHPSDLQRLSHYLQTVARRAA